MAPSVSVIIPARNEQQTIAACLAALRQQTVGAEHLEVLVVASGDDRTGEIATQAGQGQFARFEVLRLAEGDKNTALRTGCARAAGDTVLLLDADTELAPTAGAVLVSLLAREPRTVAHAAMVPRIDTWVARYSELNRKLVKQLQFDGHLSGEVIAMPRTALCEGDLAELFPDGIGANGDAYLGRVLRQRGWRTVYAANAVATTLFPWTLSGLMASQLRNRRAAMMTLTWTDAAQQAAKSFALVAALPAGLFAVHSSVVVAFVCWLPLILHVVAFAARSERLRRRGLGDYRAQLPIYVGLDVIARSLKLWAFLERLAGRRPPTLFRGERPQAPLSADIGGASLSTDRVKGWSR